MSCLSCQNPKTIEAHLIPKSFVAEVKVARGEQHLILHEGSERRVVSHTGVYDRDILCSACDSLLGVHEGYAVELLRELRKVRADAGDLVSVDPVDGDMLVRFAAGIAWKYAVTNRAGRIEVGRYVDRLGEVALKGAPIPNSLDVAMIRLVELDGDVYFYRTPMPDRKDGANMVRFSVGSFLFFFKIDQRRNGATLPAECWLRGRTRGSFLTGPAELFEEGRIHRSLGSGPQARSFFGEMRARKRRKA